MDHAFLVDIMSGIEAVHHERVHLRLFNDPDGSIEEVISHFSEVDIVVTTRFHGVIFSFLLEKPVLALSYNPKISELMKDFGQERFCMDIEAIDFDVLTRRFAELWSMRKSVSRQVRGKVEQEKQLLEDQYTDLLRLFKDPT